MAGFAPALSPRLALRVCSCAVSPSRTFFSLSAVTRRLEELLQPALERSFWLKAEISSGRERRGVFHCELVETGPGGEVLAQMRCAIWSRDLARIRTAFAREGLELQLDDGQVVGILCRVQYHPRYGLSLAGLDMDPGVALGELELRRRRILAGLERDGLLGCNAALAVPLLPTRIALVTSRSSAAYRDFAQTLLASRFGFRIYLADSAMQGPETEASVLAALDAVERLGVDLIALVRGGGSRTDLAWLDSDAIARRIARCTIPVWTGIGHETDSSILDAVAGRACKTPTAVAEALVARFAEVDGRLGRAARRLAATWSLRVAHQRRYLDQARTGLRQGTRKLVELRRSELRRAASTARAALGTRLGRERTRLGTRRAELRARAGSLVRAEREALDRRAQRLARACRALVREAKQRLAGLRARLSPLRVTARLEQERRALRAREQALRAADPRTALARGFSLTYASGALVRSVDELVPGQATLTRLSDGYFEGRVEKISEDDDG
jgi:exodeoxyribonuclease VII large subunit